MLGALICSMGHLLSISNPTYRASRRKNYAGDGWLKLRRDRSDDGLPIANRSTERVLDTASCILYGTYADAKPAITHGNAAQVRSAHCGAVGLVFLLMGGEDRGYSPPRLRHGSGPRH